MTLRTLRSVFVLTLVLAAGGLTSGCETAPGTGRSFFTGGLSEERAESLGAQEHQKIVPQFGGTYEDPELQAYVESIGDLLVQTSETPDQDFTFTILDTPIVNAFALPGGYVYVTRGLLSIANDEAEIAGVMAHEIGHVTARHSAERYGQTMLANIAQVGLAILTGSQAIGNAAGTVGTLAVRSFSREQESEADTLGIRYLTRAGYDPNAMASFLETLLDDSRLQDELAGRESRADRFNIMQTHPRTTSRIRDAAAAAGVATVRDPMRQRDVYLRKLDGMVYGDSPEQGFIRSQRFLHPTLRLAFEVPPGYRLVNSNDKVMAEGPRDAVFLFDRASKEVDAPIRSYLTDVWGRGLTLANVETIDINGLPAATARTRIRTRSGARDVRLIAIRFGPDTIYRMLFLTPPEATDALRPGMRATTYSFRKLSEREASRLSPMRLRVHTVRPGETAESLAARMPFPDRRLDRFLVLNGLEPGARLSTGQQVKLVVE